MVSPEYLEFEYLTNYYLPVGNEALTPQKLSFYRTDTDNVYVFYWRFQEIAYSPLLADLVYELQIDNNSSFSSPQVYRLDTVQTSLFTGLTTSFSSADTIGDVNLNLVPNQYIGATVQITAGTGVGQIGVVASNTINTFTLTTNWFVVPDSTSVYSVFQSNVLNFQNGNVAKGFEVVVPNRHLNPQGTFYARVRTLLQTSPLTNFSSTLTFQLLNAVDVSTADALITSLPDYHIYNQDVAKLPLSQRVTLLWKVMFMYGTQFDNSFLVKELTRLDNYLLLTRDENLFDNWGTFFSFPKPNNMVFVDYRVALLSLVAAALEGSTIDAITQVVEDFYGVSPLIQPIRDIADFFLTTIQEVFPAPGTTNIYRLVQNASFVPNTMQIFRDGPTTHTLLTSGVDFFPSERLPGFSTLITDPSGNTLTVFYDISEPEPLIFDPADVGLLLTGVMGLTHGNNHVFGIGSSFFTQLTPGNQIGDGQVWGTVQAISSNVELTLTSPWQGNTELVDLIRLKYTDQQIPPNTIWDKNTQAFGVLVTVNNPGQFNIDQNTIEFLIKQILPAHVKLFIEFN